MSAVRAVASALLAHAIAAPRGGDGSRPAAPRCLFASRGELHACVLQVLGASGSGDAGGCK
eukprot:4484510-Alexandrium_andersonii.AAC.1